MNQSILQKLVDDDLVRFASSTTGTGRRSVIVELVSDAETAVKTLKEVPRREELREGTRDPERRSSAMDQVQGRLESLDLPSPPVRLDIADAFVVDVTPAELQTIANWDQVGVVRLNRTRRVRQFQD